MYPEPYELWTSWQHTQTHTVDFCQLTNGQFVLSSPPGIPGPNQY